MIIIYTIHEKAILVNTYTDEYDPLTGEKGIEMAVSQRYVSIAGIPLNGTRKMVKAYSITAGHPIPVLLWTDGMKMHADNMLPLVKGTWKRRLFFPLFFGALALLIGWGALAIYNQNNTRKAQAEYVANPAAGDIIMAKVIESHYKTNAQSGCLMVFKISHINGDSLFVIRNPQRVDMMELYRIKNLEKITTSLFDLSDTAFTGETEVYNLTKYREADERLRRHVTPYETLDAQARKAQDDFLNFTDIIEPKYIKRPKK